MMNHPFSELKARNKTATTARVIDRWISDAARLTGHDEKRLGWMLASSIVVAALQRLPGENGKPRIIVKGGAYLEMRLGLESRTTKDVDLMLKGNFDLLGDAIDDALNKPYQGFTFERSEFTTIPILSRKNRPVRFIVFLKFGGKTWRKVKIDLSADEGKVGVHTETFPAPPLQFFGLDVDDVFEGLGMPYQAAQKLYACTRPETRERPNDRCRDIVDLLLIRDAFFRADSSLTSVRHACEDVFGFRTTEQIELTGEATHQWPALLSPPNRWAQDYPDYRAGNPKVPVSFDDGVAAVNEWIKRIVDSK